jgi:serine/threonine protein kinase
MLTSEYPYWDASTTRLFRMIIQLPPPIDRPQFSPALRDLLSRLLDKFPQKRITLEEVRARMRASFFFFLEEAG